jgi:hypothetical protein
MGCITEVHVLPKDVNSLIVAENRNKLRLVLDCRHINPHPHLTTLVNMSPAVLIPNGKQLKT